MIETCMGVGADVLADFRSDTAFAYVGAGCGPGCGPDFVV